LKNQGDLIWVKPTNKFICVFSAKKKAMQNVKAGFERVIASKLYDAHFYYAKDMQTGLDAMFEQTKGMTWFKGLGTLYDKALRLSAFVEVFDGAAMLDMKKVKRAAQLCKADLLSQMVREKDFTSLQGIMGGHYAKVNGEDAQVATAMSEHYLPNFIGDALPSTIEGAVLSIADKLDNVVGAFLSGNRPSGSQDPLGVRRHAYGAVQLLDVHGIDVSLYRALDALLTQYKKNFDTKVLHEFFGERVTRYLQDKGYRYDEINAVLAVWTGYVSDAHKRCEALKRFRDKQEFVKLVIGQKRVRNILKGIKDSGAVSESRLKENAEKQLYAKGKKTALQLGGLLKNKDYPAAMKLLLALRSDIDTFFDDVMVMCDDTALRKNRLALVSFINELFLQCADFSEIVLEGEKQG
jgi:glycyl-tRNA synthetase beta chain